MRHLAHAELGGGGGGSPPYKSKKNIYAPTISVSFFFAILFRIFIVGGRREIFKAHDFHFPFKNFFG